MIQPRAGNPLVRPMEERDVEGVASMFIRLYRQLNSLGYVHQLDEEGLADYLRLQMASKTNGVLVAEEDGDLPGFLAFACQPIPRKFTAAHGRYVGVLSELYVEQAYRGRGYAPMLMSAGEDFFRSLGVQIIDAVVVEGNLPPLDICRDLAYVRQTTGFVKSLSPDPLV